MENLVVMTCLDAAEFNLTVRSLQVVVRRHKNIGLVVIDGLQYLEWQDNSFGDKRQSKGVAQR